MTVRPPPAGEVDSPSTSVRLTAGPQPKPAYTSGDGRAVSGSGRLYALIVAGYPVAWALGVGPLIFPFAALLMTVWLIRYRPLQPPAGTITFALFIIVVGASMIQVDSVTRMALWGLRASWYVSALITFVYLARQTSCRARLTVVRSLIALWVVSVAAGYGALFAPELSWSTPLSAALPASIAGDEFVADLIVPRLAEVQRFWTGVQLNRPAGPYPYTNAWGSSIALLTPFLLAALQDRRLGLPRWLVVALLAAGVVPFYFALNRGAWTTLIIGVAYGGLRSAFVKRQPLPLLIVTVCAALGLFLTSTTGVVDSAVEMLSTRTAASNETRANIYIETMEAAARSPMIGYGTPRPSPSNPDGPPLGTHGQLWSVVFAHGYLALALYLAFFVYGFIRGPGRDPVGHWAKVALLIGLMQMPIYGHLPMQLFILIGAVTIAAWPVDAIGPRPAPRGSGR